MKLFTFAILLIKANLLIAQPSCLTGDEYNYSINFDDGQCLEGLKIDTSSNSNNIWEIGVPEKNTFISANSLPNVIITDKLNSYPINDTSSFIIYHIAGPGFYYSYQASIEGQYYVNSDSLNDFGLIELSPDNGTTWFDIINDPKFSGSWVSPVPTLTGNSNGWNYFYFDVLRTAGMLGITSGDTLKYRFTFISDNNLDSLDGLMFDGFILQDWVEGINEIESNKIESNIFPNPARSTLTIEIDNPNHAAFEIKVIDNIGKEVMKSFQFKEDSIILDISNLDTGIYTYIIRSSEDESWSSGKIIKDK